MYISEIVFSLVAAFLNCVRGVIKVGYEDQYIDALENWPCPKGMMHRYVAKTGDRDVCFVVLWESEEMLVEARPEMLEYLNSVRKYLDEISIEL